MKKKLSCREIRSYRTAGGKSGECNRTISDRLFPCVRRLPAMQPNIRKEEDNEGFALVVVNPAQIRGQIALLIRMQGICDLLLTRQVDGHAG